MEPIAPHSNRLVFRDNDATSISSLTNASFNGAPTAWNSGGALFLNNSILYGREEETALLKESFRRSCLHDASSNKKKNEVVLVHGPSGVGKSELVEESMRNHVFEVEDGYFVMGKFDQFSWSCRPFSAITDLLTDLVMIMIDQVEGKELLRRTNNLFSTKLLQMLIPNLSQILPTEVETPPVVEEDEFLPNGHMFQQLKSACVQFLDMVSQFRPLLLYFDDLQWADEYSLEIIKAIACNDPAQRSSLSVICSLRDEFVVDGEEDSRYSSDNGPGCE